MFRKISVIFLCLIFVSNQYVGQAATVENREITTHCNAAMASLVSTNPHEYVSYFEWLNTPKAASQLANEKLPNTVTTIAVAPVTANEYKKIFAGTKEQGTQGITEAQRKEIRDVKTTLNKSLGRDSGDRDFVASDYKRILENQTASFIIVIGHNDRGTLRHVGWKFYTTRSNRCRCPTKPAGYSGQLRFRELCFK